MRRRKTTRVFWRIALGLLAAFALVAGTSIGYIYSKSETSQRIMSVWRTGRWKPASAFPNKSDIIVLFLGKDVNYDRNGRVIENNARTDTILLAHLDFAERTADILSIPRDTMVHIPGYRNKRKINSAHAYGGPELAKRTVDNYLGVQTDEYIVLDYQSFAQVIDLLGGVELRVNKQMDYDDNWGNLHIHLEPGTQVLNGQEALGFVRFRKSNDGHNDSDLDRIERQHQLLMAAKSKILSVNTFFRLPDVFDTVRGGTISSMDDAQLMCIAMFIRSLPREAVKTATLSASDGNVYASVCESEARRIVNEVFY